MTTPDDVTGDFDLAAEEEPGPEERLDAKPYDPDQDRERVRGRIAYGLLALIAGLTITLMVLGALGRSIDDLTKLHAIILTPLITLTSGIVGFYFGAQTKRG